MGLRPVTARSSPAHTASEGRVTGRVTPVLRCEYNIRVPIETILPAYTSTLVSTSNLPTEPADPCDTVRPEMLSPI